MSWSCQIQRFPEQKVDDFDGITVGEVLGLECQGEPVELQSKDEIHFVPPKDAPLSYKILQVQEASASGGKFLFTTYLAPQNEWTGLQLTDGKVSWNVEIQGEAVVSVLPEEGGEPPVPYGPYGPFVLVWPMWLFLFLIPMAALLFLPARWIWVRMKRTKKLRSALEKHGIRSTAFPLGADSSETKASSPMPAFHKAQRHIVKALYAFRSGTPEERGEVIGRMRESLKNFLLLEFRVLMDKEISGREERRLKNQLKSSVAPQLLKDLKMVLTELGRAEQDLKNVSVDQAQRLLELTRVLVLRLEEAHRGKRRAHGVA